MAGLRLGPLLRYVDWESGSTATVWVEASRPCTGAVRWADGGSGAAAPGGGGGGPSSGGGGAGGGPRGATR
ncbi:alkaline phosphatase family protein, partial [Streptomyces anulatus]